MDQTNFSVIGSALLSAGSGIINSIANFLPTLLAAILVFLVGVLIAKLAKGVTTKTLSFLHLNKLVTSPSIKRFFSNAEITGKVEDVVGEIVRYLILLIFFVASINVLGLHTVTQVLTGLLAYLPQVFAALLILLTGAILAGFVEKIVKGSVSSFDIQLARLLAKIASYTIMILFSLASISQLGIAQSFIDTIFVGFIATISLAIGLSVGLGAKDTVKKIIEEQYRQLKKTS